MSTPFVMSYDDEFAKYIATPEDTGAQQRSFTSDESTLYGATLEAITMGYRITGFDASVAHLVDAKLQALVNPARDPLTGLTDAQTMAHLSALENRKMRIVVDGPHAWVEASKDGLFKVFRIGITHSTLDSTYARQCLALARAKYLNDQPLRRMV
jgi:hypothetical protein